MVTKLPTTKTGRTQQTADLLSSMPTRAAGAQHILILRSRVTRFPLMFP